MTGMLRPLGRVLSEESSPFRSVGGRCGPLVLAGGVTGGWVGAAVETGFGVAGQTGFWAGEGMGLCVDVVVVVVVWLVEACTD